MGSIEQLALHKNTIVEKWFARVMNTYPAETARFLRSQKDPFANPVGQTTFNGLNTVIGLLGTDLNTSAARAALDPIMRIRAIQDFSPAQATCFVFDLKGVIRAVIPPDRQTTSEMTMIERRIDELALIAFDIYMQCREKLYELKANEVKERTYKAFARAGLIKEPGDE
jgi:hypothetical protein